MLLYTAYTAAAVALMQCYLGDFMEGPEWALLCTVRSHPFRVCTAPHRDGGRHVCVCK